MRVQAPGRSGLFVVFLLVTAGFVLIGDALKKGEDLLIQRKYKEAATQLEKALTEAPATEKLPGQRVLSAPVSDDEDSHGPRRVIGEGGGPRCGCHGPSS